jgi:hypothetical protein
MLDPMAGKVCLSVPIRIALVPSDWMYELVLVRNQRLLRDLCLSATRTCPDLFLGKGVGEGTLAVRVHQTPGSLAGRRLPLG